MFHNILRAGVRSQLNKLTLRGPLLLAGCRPNVQISRAIANQSGNSGSSGGIFSNFFRNWIPRSGMWPEVGIAFGMQVVGWVFAVAFQTEKFYDLTGSLTFITVVNYVLWTRFRSLSAAQLIQMACVFAWTARLGSFLFMRVMSAGEDRRFRQIKTKPLTFLFVWGLQGAWVIMSLLPSLIMWQKAIRGTPISTVQLIGWAIWAFGFIFEVIADRQKSEFRADPANKDSFIQTGLWSVSRHPNYFGEILLWFGLYMSASPSFSGIGYLSILGPIFNALLISFVSGIPMLEAHADKKWGSNVDYQQYKARTPVLFPRLW